MLTWVHQRMRTSRFAACAPERHRSIRKRSLGLPLATAVFFLAACRTGGDSLQKAATLESKGKIEQALDVVGRTLSGEPVNSRLHWQLALRKAELLEKTSTRGPPEITPLICSFLLIAEMPLQQRIVLKPQFLCSKHRARDFATPSS